MKKFKTLLLLLSLTLAKNTCFAQNKVNENYEKFTRSFTEVIDYPIQLFTNCTSTVCLIKIEVDVKKKIIDMQLSDSADSLLSVEFKKHKKNLNVKLLENYLNTEYAKNTCNIYVIPLSYSLYKMPCPPQNIQIDLLNRYFKFNGAYLTSDVVLLKPIISTQHIQK